MLQLLWHGIYNFYNSFEKRHPNLETAFERSSVFLLKLEEQRLLHTLNCPTITLCGELSCVTHSIVHLALLTP